MMDMLTSALEGPHSCSQVRLKGVVAGFCSLSNMLPKFSDRTEVLEYNEHHHCNVWPVMTYEGWGWKLAKGNLHLQAMSDSNVSTSSEIIVKNLQCLCGLVKGVA